MDLDLLASIVYKLHTGLMNVSGGLGFRTFRSCQHTNLDNGAVDSFLKINVNFQEYIDYFMA